MENKKIILGLCGQISSGKGTIAEYAQKKYNAKTFRFSTMLRDVLSRLYLDITRYNMQTLSTILRTNFSEDIMAKVMAEDVKNDSTEIIIVDGVRRMADITYLKEINGFYLVSVKADAKIRFERLTKRNENSDDLGKTYEDFLKDEQQEAELEIPIAMQNADLEIDNNGSMEDLFKQVDDIILKRS